MLRSGNIHTSLLTKTANAPIYKKEDKFLLEALDMRSDIIEILRKLIEHEKSANAIGNFAEAEAFAEKIQQLMQAHDLTMADLGWQAPEWQEEFEMECATHLGPHFKAPRPRPSWQEVLGSTMEAQQLRSSR